MLQTGLQDIEADLRAMRKYFDSGTTLPYRFRKEQLQILRSAVSGYEDRLNAALYQDLKKSPEEIWVTETGFFTAEINKVIRNLKKWMRPRKVPTNLLNLPSRSYIFSEPLGVVLIIAPWNYPFQLLLAPLIGAIAAGNCVVLKPSEFAPATASVLKEMFKENFPPGYIQLVEGQGSEVIPHLMQEFAFDHIFYTGSTEVGRIIYREAAEKLIPVTLELGGKSPAIVEEDADIKIAAKRIAVVKFSNAGQMCVAPDYVLVHRAVKGKFLKEIELAINSFYPEGAKASRDYGRIINRNQYNRLLSFLEGENVVSGGETSADDFFIGPTIIDEPDLESPLMQEEIFGPLLPVISFEERKTAMDIVQKNKNPLALYVFTSNKKTADDWIKKVPFGGGCINNASFHLLNPNLPFGGRGSSGLGNYHGRFSFDTFSHKKSILKTPVWFDPSIKYPPYDGKLGLLKRIIR